MPPPTVANQWLHARRFGVVIDAGSSGSRAQIYSWRDARVVRVEQGRQVYHSLPKVEKGTRTGEDWVTKVEPGLSSFADDPEGIAAYLVPLLEHARSKIPPSLHAETPLFLLATAGMRLLSPEKQAKVLEATCHFLRFHSEFKIHDSSPVGPCGSSIRIITGEEEGLFGWIAVNYLMDGFGPRDEDRTTYGFLDMGGASTQIAFEPSKEERERGQNLIDVRLRLMGGEEIRHQVFVTTWLGYGTNQARERYVGQAIDAFEQHRISSGGADIIEDPCLPKDLHLTESPVHSAPSTSHAKQPHTLVGTGSFSQCLRQVAPLLNKTAFCPDAPCLFNGVHVPPIDFSASHFIGVSEYWYSSEDVFGLGGGYNYVEFERAAQTFCGNEWSNIMRMHEEAKERGRLGGDGEVLADSRVVGLGKWGDKVERSRLEMQCFKAAWIANVLHEGLGMPRLVDPGGNDTTGGGDANRHADQKGLGRPTFQSMDSVGDIAISWTLGKMVLEASKEVPPLVKDNPPLVDPLEDSSDTDDSPVHPIRPPFHLDFDAIEDEISAHLPPSLSRHSLGFSFVGFVFYLTLFFAFLLVVYRLRLYMRVCLRRFTPSSPKRDPDLVAASMEEGHFLNRSYPTTPISPRTPGPPSSRRWLYPLRRIASFWRTRPPSLSTHIPKSVLRHIQPSPARISPTRSMSYPGSQYLNGAAPTSTSTATSPTLSSYDDISITNMHGDAAGMPGLSSYSRSRNSSTLSLSTLMPRQPLSRTNSALHLPSGGSLWDK